MIVLVGFMAAGKTTVGRLLAAELDLPFVDTDEEIEARAGAGIADIFASGGEASFREIESAVVADVLAGPDAVIALGGGALGDPATRAALAGRTVVHLDVGLDEALRRAGDGSDRPMLGRTDPDHLYASRREDYERAATFSVPAAGRSPEETARAVAEHLGRRPRDEARRVRVELPDRPYDVVVGAGIAATPWAWLPESDDREKAFIVTHRSLEGLLGPLESGLAETGLYTEVIALPEGESSKSIDAAMDVYGRLASAAAHRSDLIVSFGGGVVSDLAGFVASTWVRGLPVVHVPTTLLGQVDASIGGKTGVNFADFKNMVGTIYQPAAVACDVVLLADLPPEELRSGLAEVAKYGFIAEPDLLDTLVRSMDRIVERDPDVLADIVERSVRIKAAIVAADERERGERAHLNYGHTFGHAIEHALGGGRIRHGEAISLGMMAAAHTARALGRIDDDDVERHREVLGAAGLPVSASLDFDALEQAWARDKKYRRGVRFVLLSGIGKPEAGITVARAVLEEAVAELGKGRGE